MVSALICDAANRRRWLESQQCRSSSVREGRKADSKTDGVVKVSLLDEGMVAIKVLVSLTIKTFPVIILNQPVKCGQVSSRHIPSIS